MSSTRLGSSASTNRAHDIDAVRQHIQGVRVECAKSGEDYSIGQIVPYPRQRPRRARVPADAVTASGSGLDPHISTAYADLQVARVAKARGISPDQVRAAGRRPHIGRALGFFGEPPSTFSSSTSHSTRTIPRGAIPEIAPWLRTAANQPDPTTMVSNSLPGSVDESGERSARRQAEARRTAHLLGCGTRRRQDVRDARRGAPPARARHRRGRRGRGDARPQEDRRSAGRHRGRGAALHRVPGKRFAELDVEAVLAAAAGGAGRRTRPHQHPGQQEPEALAGRRGVARRRHHGDLDGQRAAPGEPQRRRHPDHRHRAAGEGARRRRARRPTRSNSSTSRRKRCSAGSPTATCMRPSASMPRCPITSARAT